MPSAATSGLHKRASNGVVKPPKNGSSLKPPAPIERRKSSIFRHQLTDYQKEEIHSLVLWRRPFRTIYYSMHQLFDLLTQLTRWILQHTKLCLLITVLISSFALLLQIEGSHQSYVQHLYKRLAWCIYWVGLGILSSVGLGTGLHTFILYLGPHIASVTLAAYECNSLDFPEPPYPDEIICPTSPSSGASINVWSIMSKVRLEAFMWGAGTALGELPPYFISRAHRLSGDTQDEMMEELEDLVPELEGENIDLTAPTTSLVNQRPSSFMHKMKHRMVIMMKRLGFFGILACASIPNPLFDLAGIICGYSLISFWTFFGATLLGKAVVKMHMQKLLVIIVFNEAYVQKVLEFCRDIPYIGHMIHDPLRDYLQQQKKSLHRGADQKTLAKPTSWIAFLFDTLVILMVTYFLVSIINSMAQSNLKQRYQKQLELKDANQSNQEPAAPSTEDEKAKKSNKAD